MQGSEDGGGDGDGGGHVDTLSTEELECKICFCSYSLGSRRPKVLKCCHCLCAKCLANIIDLGESTTNTVVCPFCRTITRMPGEMVNSLPDDCNMVMALALQSRRFHCYPETNTELVLSPRHLSSLMDRNPSLTTHSSTSSSTTYSSIRGSPNIVVITIMEPPPVHTSSQDFHLHHQLGYHTPIHSYHSSSLDSLASITQRWRVWNCAALLWQTIARVLVWVLGLLYFSSLPMGVYLLIMQRTTVGMVLVSLVPASLIMIMVYGFCQCIFHELWNCMPPQWG
ncbi:E3 ubiquitin-protein ligase RNF182 [Thalassophryne amazonica]|uniref:E3 ubiquitin-protein ligase RNF182 n=1 Tax=Thalassophryne amazonica TaxID=390379 RepID=UPI00147153D1|nr:E3 ubiquitin-protein ligase RNF182 [Thalassophryne amazonica]